MQITPQSLSKQVSLSYQKFEHFRKARQRFVYQMATRHYHASKVKDEEGKKASPLNMIFTAATTLVPNLVYTQPKVRVKTDIMPFRDYADTLEAATNSLVKKINLTDTLRTTIFDSIFLAGFIKTGIASAGESILMDGVQVEVGQPFAERIDPDDIILDPLARGWYEQSFIGNRWRADITDLEETGLYDPEQLRKLQASSTDPRDTGMADMTGKDEALQLGELRKYVDLVDIYLPREQIVITMPFSRDGSATEFLRVAEYVGPATGPYHMLAYTPVSDNIMPVAPAMVWYDLHILGNRIARKLARQAERMKQVLAYEDTATDDAVSIAEADDGEAVKVGDVNKIKEVKYGGAPAESYQWMEWVKRNFSEQANSMDMLSGTGSNTPTATQAELLQANTSVRLADMQSSVYNFAAAISRDLAFFLHTDPLIELPLVKRVQGVEQQVVYTPEMRQGDFFDFVFSVQPYSMARPDPNVSVRRKLEFATTVIPAAAQAVAILGPGFKIGPFLKRMAIEVGIEDADEWLDDVAFQEWMMQRVQQAMMQGDPGKAGGAMKMPQMGAVPTGYNPGQPNPSATGPIGGISPATEQAAAQQESAAEGQAGRQPSARSLAMAR